MAMLTSHSPEAQSPANTQSADERASPNPLNALGASFAEPPDSRAADSSAAKTSPMAATGSPLAADGDVSLMAAPKPAYELRAFKRLQQLKIIQKDIDEFGHSDDCLKCADLKAGNHAIAKTHSHQCRLRFFAIAEEHNQPKWQAVQHLFEGQYQNPKFQPEQVDKEGAPVTPPPALFKSELLQSEVEHRPNEDVLQDEPMDEDDVATISMGHDSDQEVEAKTEDKMVGASPISPRVSRQRSQRSRSPRVFPRLDAPAYEPRAFKRLQQLKITQKDIDEFGHSDDCPKCADLKAGHHAIAKTHSHQCRLRFFAIDEEYNQPKWQAVQHLF